MRRALAAVTIGLAVVGLAGCGNSLTAEKAAAQRTAVTTASPSATFDINGTFLLWGRDNYTRVGDTCTGDGGYSDIRDGASVTVKDNAGKVVALGALEQQGKGGDACGFKIDVADVPGGAGFYAIEVSHRGEATVTEADARAPLGVSLEIGK